MATYEEIATQSGPSVGGPDAFRRQTLQKISRLTGRPLIIYAVEMFNQGKINASPFGAQSTIINLSDKSGFVEALRGIEGDEIDVILHSPGGSPEATESIVRMLRERFKSVRFIVPAIAKSAATMMCMSGDEIIVGVTAELGPTDPQMVINGKQSPAHGIIGQFEAAKGELGKNNKALPAWLPILEQYGPALLAQCETAIKLSNKLVAEWLRTYMFKDDTKQRARYKADKISKYLTDKKHLSHSRAITVDELKKRGLKIKSANEISPEFSTAIEDLRISIEITFSTTGAVKFFENKEGKGVFQLVAQIITPGQIPPGLQPSTPKP
jgi:hypothetical protein